MLATALALFVMAGLTSTSAVQDPRLTAPYIPPGTIFCDVAAYGPVIQATNSPGSKPLQLTCDTTQATLAHNGFYGGYDYGDGKFAADDGCHPLYYDIAVSSYSWKPIVIVFEDPSPSTNWYFNPVTNILQANKTSTYKTTSTFIICGTPHFVYLQTGSDIPPDGDCFTTELQLSSINGPVFAGPQPPT